MKLPLRLLAIAGFIPQGTVIADIGTDHAILPAYLVTQGICPQAIASDLNKGPLEAARKTVTEAGLTEKVSLRLGNGFESINENEADIAVIAGMGGGTIRKIIEACDGKCPVEGLVMQPMGDADHLRLWLAGHGWKIVDEDVVFEEGRYYEIIYSVRGLELTEDKTLLSLGPRLFEKKHPLLEILVRNHIDRNRKVINSLGSGTGPEAEIKRNEYIERTKRLEWILNACKMSDSNKFN